MNNRSRQAIWLALAGSIVLMIGMGYGRFAFTGVLPLMLNEGLLTLHQGNLAASANYAGYLVGALLLARVQPGAASRLSIISAGLTIAVDHYCAARRRRRAERDNADCWFAVAAGTYGPSSRGAVAVCRGGAGDIYLCGGDRPWTCPEPHQPADLAALRIMRRSAAGAGDPLAADSAGCTGEGFPC